MIKQITQIGNSTYRESEIYDFIKKINDANDEFLSRLVKRYEVTIQKLEDEISNLKLQYECTGCEFNYLKSNRDMDTGVDLGMISPEECYKCNRNTRPVEDMYKQKEHIEKVNEVLSVQLANNKSREQLLEEVKNSPNNPIFKRAIEIQIEKGWK